MLCCAWLHSFTRHLCVGCACAFCRSAVQAGWPSTRCQLCYSRMAQHKMSAVNAAAAGWPSTSRQERSTCLLQHLCCLCGNLCCVQQLVHIADFFVVGCGDKESYSAGYAVRSSCSCQQSAAVGAAAAACRVVSATALQVATHNFSCGDVYLLIPEV
jgi:hypothetical protein